jgi:NADH:ubiquinone oxidoreductase subunit E
MSERCYECDPEKRQKYDEIANVIDLYKDKQGSLIQILHLAQEIYGYLPLELQMYIARSLDKPYRRYPEWLPFIPSFLPNREAGIQSEYVLEQPAMSEVGKSL